ncbi:MAG: hypothetical protein K9G59_18215 [Caulobacter sp.]|nr:hypothetical protein [Caulobacter sp.]
MIKVCLAALLLVAPVVACEKPQSTSCASISSSEALDMARNAKRGMLSRSTVIDQRTFESDKVAEVRTKAEGYAAKVTFTGLGGARLTALIEDDCYLGWTESRPAGAGS